MSNDEYDIAVVGAGAAGLTAAMFAKRTAPDARVIALDGAPKIGAKILISGGGRCNVTHFAVTADDFNGNRNAIARVLRTFTVDETVRWLADLGVTLRREETGKLFPTTDRAKTIVDALLRGCEGVEIRTNARVQTIEGAEGRALGAGQTEASPPGSPAPCPLPSALRRARPSSSTALPPAASSSPRAAAASRRPAATVTATRSPIPWGTRSRTPSPRSCRSSSNRITG